jgi:hypothetical protein
MIKIEDYISSIYVDYIISIEDYEETTGNKCYFDKGEDVYQYGLFYDKKKYYHVNILGGPQYLKQKVREIKLNKILK